MNKKSFMPEGFHTVTPYLTVKDGSKAIEFYQIAFDAKVMERHDTPEGKVLHAQIQIGDSRIMLSDEFPGPQSCGMAAPSRSDSISHMIHLYVENVDISFSKALQAGAKTVMPVEDTFWGDRYGQLEDPFGHRWSVSTPLDYLGTKKSHKSGGSCCGCSHE